MLLKTKRRHEANNKYVDEVSQADTWKNPPKKALTRLDLERDLCEASGINRATIHTLMKHIFGSSRENIRGLIQQYANKGMDLDIEGFGRFYTRRKKAMLVRHPVYEDCLTYTPESATMAFKMANNVRWDCYRASIMAHMPDEPLPEGWRFSSYIQRMPFYADWYEKMYGERPTPWQEDQPKRWKRRKKEAPSEPSVTPPAAHDDTLEP